MSRAGEIKIKQTDVKTDNRPLFVRSFRRYYVFGRSSPVPNESIVPSRNRANRTKRERSLDCATLPHSRNGRVRKTTRSATYRRSWYCNYLMGRCISFDVSATRERIVRAKNKEQSKYLVFFVGPEENSTRLK